MWSISYRDVNNITLLRRSRSRRGRFTREIPGCPWAVLMRYVVDPRGVHDPSRIANLMQCKTANVDTTATANHNARMRWHQCYVSLFIYNDDIYDDGRCVSVYRCAQCSLRKTGWKWYSTLISRSHLNKVSSTSLQFSHFHILRADLSGLILVELREGSEICNVKHHPLYLFSLAERKRQIAGRFLAPVSGRYSHHTKGKCPYSI